MEKDPELFSQQATIHEYEKKIQELDGLNRVLKVLRLSKDSWYYGKVIVGHALGENANTELAMEAWGKAKFMLRRLGQKIEGIIIHYDQDGVYIGHRWLHQVAVKDKVRVSYSDNGAKGNVYSESFIGRFKSENRLLFWEQEDFEGLEEVVKARIKYYNRVRRHSALGNKSPIEYLNRKTNI